MTDGGVHGTEYRALISRADLVRVGCSKPSWLSLGLQAGQASKLLLIRTMALGFTRHENYSDDKGVSIPLSDAYCPVCFADHKGGPVPQFYDNTLHALLDCKHMRPQQDALAQDIQQYLQENPLYLRQGGQWKTCVWTDLSPKLQKSILLGGPLHKSRWAAIGRPIKDWQRAFLDFTTPKTWDLLKIKERLGRRVPSGA